MCEIEDKIYVVIDSDDNLVCVFDSYEDALAFLKNKQNKFRLTYRIEVVKSS